MPVRRLSVFQKKELGNAYRAKTLNQKELAQYYGVSERTVNRVLIELGFATPVARIKGEAYKVMKLLNKHNIDYKQLEALIAGQAPMRMPGFNHQTRITTGPDFQPQPSTNSVNA